VQETGGELSKMLADAGIMWQQLGQAIDVASSKVANFKTAFEQAKEANDLALKAVTALSPSGKAQSEFDRSRSQALQQGRTETEALTLAQGAYNISIKQSGVALAKAAQARALAGKQNVESAQLELDIGKTAGEQAKLSANLQARRTPSRLFRRMLCQRRLAYLDRLPPKVCAVQLQEVEGVQERPRLVPAMAEQRKAAKPSSSQHTTSPSIRQERTLRWFTASTTSGKRSAQSLPRLVSRHGIAAGHQAIAVVLDLMNPVPTRRRLVRW
jgi:hypothetical protein